MSELPGTAAVGIETVEWFAEGGGNLTVRITGRWRRRRPAGGGQPTLVVEAEGRRHRFPAMPEPPSLGGIGPGMWRLSFSLPGSLAPDLGGRAWLQIGTVIVPLAIGGAASGDPGSDGRSAEAQPQPEPSPAGPEPGAAEPASEDDISSLRRLRRSELEATRARRRADAAERAAAELEARIGALERDLGEARAEHEQLAASLADRDRNRRVAEQRAHAEQALRRDLVRQLASAARETERARESMGELAAAEDRIRTLERELRGVRRKADEAEQVAAAAEAARERAERARAAPPPRVPPSTEFLRLRFEHDLVARRAGGGGRVLAEPDLPVPPVVPPAARAPAVGVPAAPADDLGPPVPRIRAPSGPVAGVAVPDDSLMQALERELDARASAEAGLRARLVDAEARLAARVLLAQRTTATLGQLRGELDGLRAALERERAIRVAAQRRATGLELVLTGQQRRLRAAYDAIDELRGALGQLRSPESESESESEPESEPEAQARAAPDEAPPPGSDEPETAGLVEPETAGLVEPARLSDALTRLRETIAPQDPAPAFTVAAREPSLRETVARPTLAPMFARLVRADAQAAGRLLLELLPLQRIAYPHPVSYDLVLGASRGCVRVMVGSGAPAIGLQGAPGPRDEVDFQVFGDLTRIARLLSAGALRRRLRLGVARVRGRREGFAALEALLGIPLDLRALHGAGVRLDPPTACALVASMIDPAWTLDERFTLAHEDPETGTTYLVVGGGRRIEVTRRVPGGRIATTVAGPADDLLLVLAGAPARRSAVRGDEGPLALLRAWVKRAQSE